MFRFAPSLMTLSLISLLTACGGADDSGGSGDSTRLADCIDTDLLKQQMLAEVNAARS